MKLSLELPTAYLDYFSKLTDFEFCLAQVALESPEYAEFYKKQGKAGRMVILDNGFHEMGRPLSVPELEKAVELVTPSLVVAPDWIGKPVETFDAFEKMAVRMKGHPSTSLAAVLVGRDQQERASYFMNVAPRVKMLCFPYREPRQVWFQELFESYPRVEAWPQFIHLLGMSDFEEAQWWKRIERRWPFPPYTLSIDTAKPVKWGLENIPMDFDTNPRGSKVSSADLHKITDIDPAKMQMILRNLAYLRRFI